MQYTWRFNEEVTKTFDTHVRNSIPLYDVFHSNILELAKYYIRPNSDIIDIGTSTGHFISTVYNSKLDRNNKYIGVDIEPEMIKECRERYKDTEISFVLADAKEVDYSSASVITAILTLQFMTYTERNKLLHVIHDNMKKGSVLFIVEKIKTDNTDLHDAYNDLYYDFKRSQGESDSDILDKNISLRGVMFPQKLSVILKDLDYIGFSTDIMMKYNNFVSIIAIKN